MALNNAVEIRREILMRLSKLILNDELVEKITPKMQMHFRSDKISEE